MHASFYTNSTQEHIPMQSQIGSKQMAKHMIRADEAEKESEESRKMNEDWRSDYESFQWESHSLQDRVNRAEEELEESRQLNIDWITDYKDLQSDRNSIEDRANRAEKDLEDSRQMSDSWRID